MDAGQMSDITEIEQLLARYAAGMTQHDIDTVIKVFTPDGVYSVFGQDYSMTDFETLTQGAPTGLYVTSAPALELDSANGTGTGVQPICFVSQTDHELRIGYYSDTYERTTDGWRIASRAMTFLRRSGARDSGRPH